jgi:hypothetical protein
MSTHLFRNILVHDPASPWRRRVQIACLLLATLSACGPDASPRPGNGQVVTAQPECRMPTERTVVRAEDGAVLETWELALADVATDALPDEPGFLEYRAAIERDGANLRRPVADPPVIDSEELADVWRDEFLNNDLVFDGGVGSVDAITCLDALLFARQAGRVSQVSRPTEFLASVLRRETIGGTRLLVVFGAGEEMFVPRDFYGLDVVEERLAEGWALWYAIHNHTTQRNGERLALGVPVPSTSDVRLLRSLQAELGLDSLRVTNGFYTFRAAVDDLSEFRAR